MNHLHFSKILHLFLPTVAALVFASVGLSTDSLKTGTVAFDMQFLMWDSARFETELQILTWRLEDGSITQDEVIQWSEMLLSENRFDFWLEKKQRAERHFKEIGLPQVSIHRSLNWLYAPMRDSLISLELQPHFNSGNEDRAAWMAALGQFQLDLLTLDPEVLAYSFSAVEHLKAQKSSPAFQLNKWLPWLTLFSFLALVLQVIKFLRTSVSKHTGPPSQRFASLRKHIELNRPDEYSRMAILELTFHIRRNEIVENIRQKNLWEELSERQKLALWFFHEDCSVDDSAKYLEISKGHLYNMRSELRRHFKLKDEDPITHIWSSPVNL